MRTFLLRLTGLLLLPVLILNNRLRKTPAEGYMTLSYLQMHSAMQLQLLNRYRWIPVLLIVGALLLLAQLQAMR